MVTDYNALNVERLREHYQICPSSWFTRMSIQAFPGSTTSSSISGFDKICLLFLSLEEGVKSIIPKKSLLLGTLQEGALGGATQDGQGPFHPCVTGNRSLVASASSLAGGGSAGGIASQAARPLRYYGITGNAHALVRFLHEARRLWRKWLDRRSWQARITWEKFARLCARYPLPQPSVVHSIYRRVATP